MLKYSVQIACIHFNVCPSNIYYNYKLHLPHSKSQFEFVQVVVKSYTSFILDKVKHRSFWIKAFDAGFSFSITLFSTI